MFEYIKSDLYRYAGNISIKSFIVQYLRNSAFRYLVAFRLCNMGGGESIRKFFMDL